MDELIYTIKTRQSFNRRHVNKSNQIVDMNLNPATVNSVETEIVVFIENDGLVATDWYLEFFFLLF
jgi:hypothetical protein